MATIDERIVGHIDELVRLVEEDVDGIEKTAESDLGDYGLHVSNLMVNLDKVVSRIEMQHLRLLRSLARRSQGVHTNYIGSETRRMRRRLGRGLFGSFWRLMLCKDYD